MPQFTYQRRVHFADTDMAGIMHFANFYRYMEETEHEYFRTLGLDMMHREPDGSMIGWPRVRSSCSYHAPAHYNDLLEIDLNITRKGVKSLTIAFDFRRGETSIAKGEVKTVCCRWRDGEPFSSVEIPSPFQELLLESPAPAP